MTSRRPPSPQELDRQIQGLVTELQAFNRYRKNEGLPSLLAEYGVLYELAYGKDASVETKGKAVGAKPRPTESVALDGRRFKARGTCTHVANMVDGMISGALKKLHRIEETIEAQFVPDPKGATLEKGPLEPVEPLSNGELASLEAAQRRRYARGEA